MTSGETALPLVPMELRGGTVTQRASPHGELLSFDFKKSFAILAIQNHKPRSSLNDSY